MSFYGRLDLPFVLCLGSQHEDHLRPGSNLNPTATPIQHRPWTIAARANYRGAVSCSRSGQLQLCRLDNNHKKYNTVTARKG
ncbi:hypothetical protein D5086_008976 [Populus alba]|uniref:Uncharacterized protein n=1 Tax=Populus alba TaxID=43335 RepID=A0ACC4CID5_POPAL